MNADENQAALTERIIGALFEVSNTLGSGFLEKVYERALLRELKLRGLAAVSQASFRVMYKGESVGEYFGDIVVEDAVVIELKCADRLGSEHVAPVPVLPARLGKDALSTGQLPEANCGIQARRLVSLTIPSQN